MRCPRVSVAEDDVVQPVRHNTLRVHQLTDCLKHSFEVVFFGLAAHKDVETLIHILEWDKRGLVSIPGTVVLNANKNVQLLLNVEIE